MSQQHQHKNRAGMWFLIFSFPYLIMGILGVIGCLTINSQLKLVQSTLPERPEYIRTLCPTCEDYILNISGVVNGILIMSIVLISMWVLMVIILLIGIRSKRYFR